MNRSELELGDEPVKVERRARPGVVVSVRLSPDEADKLFAIAAERQVTLSHVAREAVRAYLHGTTAGRPSLPPWSATTTGEGRLVVFQPQRGQACTYGQAPELTVA